MKHIFPRVLVIGAHMEAEAPFVHLIESGENVVGLLTLDERALAPMSGGIDLTLAAKAAGIPTIRVASVNAPASLAWIRNMEPDILLVIGWSQLLKPELLTVARIACLGFHASLLPKYRGRAPVNWAIINGEKETGNTLQVLAPGADEGDIVAQRMISIEHDDDCESVYRKVSATECEMLSQVFPLIREGTMPRLKQDSSQATVMPRRRPEDGLIDWGRSSEQLYNWVRALTHPYPGAFSYCSGQKITIWKAEIGRVPLHAPVGSIALGTGGYPVVVTGDGNLKLLTVQRGNEAAVSGVEAGLNFLKPPTSFAAVHSDTKL